MKTIDIEITDDCSRVYTTFDPPRQETLFVGSSWEKTVPIESAGFSHVHDLFEYAGVEAAIGKYRITIERVE